MDINFLFNSSAQITETYIMSVSQLATQAVNTSIQSVKPAVGVKVGIDYSLIADNFSQYTAKHSSKALNISKLDRFSIDDSNWSFIDTESRDHANGWGILTSNWEEFTHMNKYLYCPYQREHISKIVTVNDHINLMFVIDDMTERNKSFKYANQETKNKWIKLWADAWLSREAPTDSKTVGSVLVKNGNNHNLIDKIEDSNELMLRLCTAIAENSLQFLKDGNQWFWKQITAELIKWYKIDGIKPEFESSIDYIYNKPSQSGMITGIFMIQYIYDCYLNDNFINKLNKIDCGLMQLYKLCEEQVHLIGGLSNDLFSFPKEFDLNINTNGMYYLLKENDYNFEYATQSLINLINKKTDLFEVYYGQCIKKINHYFCGFRLSPSNSMPNKKVNSNLTDQYVFGDQSRSINCISNEKDELSESEIVGFCRLLRGLKYYVQGTYHYQMETQRYKHSQHLLRDLKH